MSISHLIYLLALIVAFYTYSHFSRRQVSKVNILLDIFVALLTPCITVGVLSYFILLFFTSLNESIAIFMPYGMLIMIILVFYWVLKFMVWRHKFIFDDTPNEIAKKVTVNFFSSLFLIFLWTLIFIMAGWDKLFDNNWRNKLLDNNEGDNLLETYDCELNDSEVLTLNNFFVDVEMEYMNTPPAPFQSSKRYWILDKMTSVELCGIISMNIYSASFGPDTSYYDTSFSIPSEIWKLANLRSLILWKYKKADFTIPKEIWNLENLEFLEILNTNLDTLPIEIWNLKKLESLKLKMMKLSSLPEELWELEELSYLQISYTALEEFPSAIWNLKNLKNLDISYNDDLLILPLEIWDLQNLEDLSINGSDKYDAKNNPIKTSKMKKIPSEIWKLNNLERLSITNGNFRILPAEIWDLGNISTLTIYWNEFLFLPSTIWKLKTLETLNIAGNNLSKLPLEMSNLKNLSRLDLSRNIKLWNLNAFFTSGSDKKASESGITNSWEALEIKVDWDVISIEVVE